MQYVAKLVFATAAIITMIYLSSFIVSSASATASAQSAENIKGSGPNKSDPNYWWDFSMEFAQVVREFGVNKVYNKFIPPLSEMYTTALEMVDTAHNRTPLGIKKENPMDKLQRTLDEVLKEIYKLQATVEDLPKKKKPVETTTEPIILKPKRRTFHEEI